VHEVILTLLYTRRSQPVLRLESLRASLYYLWIPTLSFFTLKREDSAKTLGFSGFT